jgi:hypothetical protein
MEIMVLHMSSFDVKMSVLIYKIKLCSGGSYSGQHKEEGHKLRASPDLWSAERRTSSDDNIEQNMDTKH